MAEIAPSEIPPEAAAAAPGANAAQDPAKLAVLEPPMAPTPNAPRPDAMSAVAPATIATTFKTLDMSAFPIYGGYLGTLSTQFV